MLIETARNGIPLDEIGVPAKTTGSMKLHLYNDGKAAISISTMEGLLRRVKFHWACPGVYAALRVLGGWAGLVRSSL